MTRPGAALALLVVVLVVPGCGQEADGRPSDATDGEAAPRVTESYDTDDPAPPSQVPAPADEGWALAQLDPPVPATVLTSVRRPDPANLPPYRLSVSTTVAAADAVCEPAGGRLPVGPGGLGDDELAGWGLQDEPAGTLSTCADVVPGTVFGVQREVLVAEQADGATVYLSAFGAPF